MSVLLLYFSAVLWYEFARSLHLGSSGDVALYHRTMQALVAGYLPYRDFDLEYPPYAIVSFAIPAGFSSLDQFKNAFEIEVLLLDAVIKFALLRVACHAGFRKRAFLGLLLFSAVGAFNHAFYLQRYDLIPAGITLAMLVSFCRGNHSCAGALLVLGAGCKLYPAIFFPPLFILAWRERKAGNFCLGACLASLPLVAAGFWMPWWRFAAFHAERGLQVESIYASALWFLKHFGVLSDVHWHSAKAWMEVTGGTASEWLPWAKAAFIAAVASATAFVSYRATKMTSVDIPRLARLLLIPLSAFVVFNIVLSPQYLIWLAVLAGVASLRGPLAGCATFLISALLTPVFFPCRTYGSGLGALETGVLLARNLLLMAALILLVYEEVTAGCARAESGSTTPFAPDPLGMHERAGGME